VLLVHMGGPFWRHRDVGAWSIPKGEHEHAEDSLAAARREFQEETGISAPPGEPIDLGVAGQAGGKLIHAWATEADVDVTEIVSNTFELEWPKGSGAVREFAEVDRAQWFDLAGARERIVQGQAPLLDVLRERIQRAPGEEPGAASTPR
jgi:predicted NUDIX family NTP pyrophosphohydrolase